MDNSHGTLHIHNRMEGVRYPPCVTHVLWRQDASLKCSIRHSRRADNSEWDAQNFTKFSIRYMVGCVWVDSVGFDLRSVVLQPDLWDQSKGLSMLLNDFHVRCVKCLKHVLDHTNGTHCTQCFLYARDQERLIPQQRGMSTGQMLFHPPGPNERQK